MVFQNDQIFWALHTYMYQILEWQRKIKKMVVSRTPCVCAPFFELAELGEQLGECQLLLL